MKAWSHWCELPQFTFFLWIHTRPTRTFESFWKLAAVGHHPQYSTASNEIWPYWLRYNMYFQIKLTWWSLGYEHLSISLIPHYELLLSTTAVINNMLKARILRKTHDKLSIITWATPMKNNCSGVYGSPGSFYSGSVVFNTFWYTYTIYKFIIWKFSGIVKASRQEKIKLTGEFG